MCVRECVRSFDNLNELREHELECEGECDHKFVSVPVSQRECKRVRVCVHVGREKERARDPQMHADMSLSLAPPPLPRPLSLFLPSAAFLPVFIPSLFVPSSLPSALRTPCMCLCCILCVVGIIAILAGIQMSGFGPMLLPFLPKG